MMTSILRDSLGGNCKTCLIVCVSPHNSDVTETIGALEFGDRANKVKLRALVNTAEVDAADFGVTDVSLDDALTSRILEL